MRTSSRISRILPAALLLACSSVRAADIYVPADYPTIGAAVAAAHQRTDGSTTIHVSPGIYAESEIVLDVSNLTLAGTVPLLQDPDGFPLDLGSQPTVAEVRKDLRANAVMFHVQALNVRITGLAFDGQEPASDGTIINIDGATFPSDGFSVDGNLLQSAGIGITSRQASGTIQGNRVTAMAAGSTIYGWSADAPDDKKVFFSNNLVIGNANVGAAFQGGTGSKLTSPPLGTGPGKLNVEVAWNEFRGNGTDTPRNANVGLSFLINDDMKSDTTLPAKIVAYVHDNRFIENRNWGFDVAQRLSMNARIAPAPALAQEPGFGFDGTFEHNSYCGNGLNAAIFDFRQLAKTLDPANPNVPLRYGRNSTYDIHAENDSLTASDFDFDNPPYDPDAHDYSDPEQLEDAGAALSNVLTFNGSTIATADTPVLRRSTPVPGCGLFLRGNGPIGNPTDLFLGSAPDAPTSKYRDSTAVKFAGGNLFREIGTWQIVPPAGTVVSPDDLSTWIGLKNSDDQGTRFDLQAELYQNDVNFATGLTRCVQGVTRNPDAASYEEVMLSSTPVVFNGADVLKIRVLTRIGTNADNSFCGGHNNATGLRLYFDSTTMPSIFRLNP